MTTDKGLMTFGDHLEVLRRMLMRILTVTLLCAAVIFVFKDITFSILLSPGECDFCTYRWIEQIMRYFDPTFAFTQFHIDLIATELSSQFMTHITTSIYLALLCTSPYILLEIFRFISPALYKEEKKYSRHIFFIIYFLFAFGVLISYFVLFPISFRFLGTYSVADKINSTITLDSYISTFTTLTFLMGLVFQLPIIAYILGRMGLINSSLLKRYRRHAILIICVTGAFITPPDIITLILVAIPLYMLYEISIKVIQRTEHKYHKNA